MVEIELDGKKVSVPEGSMVMHAADKAGTYIPHFCYHKKLSIAANCRMCLVEVEKAPKPMPACATPVTQGMVVRTQSDKAVQAQKGVMEFLLINHPLDCPICDQGGECQLQDLAVGYGGSSSRYTEEKRVVFHKDAGPLVAMEEMTRCIHCTRCVRFGQEVAGVMELGMLHRGEHAEIVTFVGKSIDSELSGNMIDLCPVGALTSKPFRYTARTWELSRRRSVSPHDSTGANLVVQVKGARVMRVLPLENEEVNECWLADRDRFSYEALNAPTRLTAPMIKQGGQWATVDWKTALDYVADGLKRIKAEFGAEGIGALGSAHGTLEELHLLGKLVRGLGSGNIDYRTRHADFSNEGDGVRWLGTSIASLSGLERAFVVGSFLRKDHPLFAQRLRAGRAQGRADRQPARRARRLGDAGGRPHHGRARRVGAFAGRGGCRRGRGQGRRGADGCESRRRGPRRGGSAPVRPAQGGAAGQRGRAAPSGRAAPGARELDRRAHGCLGGLPHGSGQHGRRPARRRAAFRGRPRCRPDADAADEGAAAAPRRAVVRCGRSGRRRRPRWPAPGWSSRSRRSWTPRSSMPTCCCPSRRSPRRPAAS